MNEGELLQFLKDNYIADLKPSEDKFSRWDCTSDKYKYRIELKCRNKHYNELILEKDKYFALINSYINTNYKPLYINSTPKGIYVFDLSIVEPNFITDNRMPKTTEFEQNHRTTKTYALISILEAKKIK
jgi:hypothetical protein